MESENQKNSFFIPSPCKLRELFLWLNQTTAVPKCLQQLSLRYPSATKTANVCKNRWFDVLPEEKTRVVLNNDSDNDYINANWVSGEVENSEKKYICCQAPLLATMKDFWQMIWENKVGVICMLSRICENEKVKADPYWPEGDEVSNYGSFSITSLQVQHNPSFTKRVLNLENTKLNETREIVQFQFTEWPDFGVPTSTESIRNLLRVTNEALDSSLEKGLDGPLVVHCSAGVGRSGAFVAIHMLLEKIKRGYPLEEIDVLGLVGKLRKQRMGMVQTEAQFKFIYDALSDLLKETKCVANCLPSPSLPNVLKQCRNFPENFPEEPKKMKPLSLPSKVETPSSNWRTCSRALMTSPLPTSSSPESFKQRSLSIDSDPRVVPC